MLSNNQEFQRIIFQKSLQERESRVEIKRFNYALA